MPALFTVVRKTVCFFNPDHDNLDKALPIAYVVSIN